MSSPKREALFNEIKGSLFEYLVAQELSVRYGVELNFLRALPPQYQTVLAQQDRMTRELYPELVTMLPLWTQQVAEAFQRKFPGLTLKNIELTGQFGHLSEGQRETDFVLQTSESNFPVSLKLNKRSSAVNTKSGGIKSFLTEYFPGPVAVAEQAQFSIFVDTSFAALHTELHETAGLAVTDGWEEWKKHGLSELPGELSPELSACLHRFYAVLGHSLRLSLQKVAAASPEVFAAGLQRLVGVGLTDLVQVICFHDLNGKSPEKTQVVIHPASEAIERVKEVEWLPAREVSFFTLKLRDWELHIRIKPMNKFTTTAIKINCAVKY